MISVVQNMDIYEIRFPYNEELLDIVRAVPGRRWNPDSKYWSIPIDKFGFFMNLILGTKFEKELSIISDEKFNKNVELGTTVKIPDIDISDIDMYVENGSNLFDHQIDCIKYSIGRKRSGNFNGFLLADDPGLGKTLEVINLALFKRSYEEAKHCLIICCVNSAKYNWIDDIDKHTNGEYEGYLLGSRLKRDGSIKLNGSGKDKLQDLVTGYKYSNPNSGKLPYFLIMNIESIRTTDNSIRKKKDKYVMTTKLIEMIKNGEISMIALDEIHKNASASSTKVKQLLRIKNETRTRVEWIPMTGTPIVNKPTDVFLPLMLVNGHQFSSFYSWNNYFCIKGGYGNHNIIGYKNIPKLKELLEPNMLRRTKNDVLDLPDKIHHVEYVENTPYQNSLYVMIENNIKQDREKIVKSLNPLASFMKLRQVNGSPELVDDTLDVNLKQYLNKNAKMKRLLELVEDITGSGEKVVIFSNWVEPLRTMYKLLVKSGYVVNAYTGTMSQEDRERDKREFIENPKVNILLGSIGALGVSHTLTVARNVIFYEEPWNAATMDQAEDRCHRAGTTDTVHIYSLVAKDTVDEVVHNLIHRKRGTSNYIVDNELDLRQHPELLDYLLRENS